MNVPNSLSAFRIILIPVFCVFFLMGSQYYVYAGAALLLSALSDMLDGFFARRLNQITELGKWLDPIADKLTLGAVVVCMWLKFHEQFPIVTPVFAILIAKELLMALGGIIFSKEHGRIIPSQWWGKLGTFLFYFCMLCIVLVSWVAPDGLQDELMTVLVVVPAAAMLFAFIRYVIVAVRVLKEGNEESPSDCDSADGECANK